jgi:hypothetical protein
MQVESSRITTIGLTIWCLYLGGHLEALDILLACIGWMAVVDFMICMKYGAAGSVKLRTPAMTAVTVWGLLGMTSGRYF